MVWYIHHLLGGYLPTRSTPLMVPLLFFTHSTTTSTSTTATMATKKADGTDAMMEMGNEVMSLDDVTVFDGCKVDWYVGVVSGP